MRKCFTRKPKFIAGVNAVVIVEAMIHLVEKSKIPPSKAVSLLWDGFLKSEKRVVVFPIYYDTLREALIQQSRHPNVEFPDCVISASMKENGIARIYTTNPKHFLMFSFIKEAIDPRLHSQSHP
jgi:predicted nucleic acid-binding protein